MVNTTATNLGRNGISEFVIQRLTAIVLTLYTVFIIGYLATHGGLDYATWRGLFDQLWMRVFTLLALLATAAHSWIGLWGILNDYATHRLMGAKAMPLRLTALVIYAVVVAAYLFWGVELLWRL